MKRCLVVYYFSKSNNHRYSREGKKKKRKSTFYRYGRRNRLFSRNCHEYLIFFALARYWRIAVAEPVLPGHGSVGSQVKLFPSLNWRPGALEMRARRLPVLWPLAFYWFNLCALSSRRYFPHRPNHLFSTSFNPSYLYSFLEIFIAPLIDSSPFLHTYTSFRFNEKFFRGCLLNIASFVNKYLCA